MRIMLLAVLCVAAARADETLKPTKEWTGRISNEAAKAAPKTGYVSGPKELEKLWKEWKVGDKPPKVDFKKELMLVVTSRGSGISLTPVIDDKGDLKARAIMTADLREDTGYLIVLVPRKGFKTFQGKELKLEMKPEEP
ncbi:MAG: hypothetical protein K2W96_28520 [Gemmataceae bacterium]|nr:hypothetical protein [Gemmataceae bacterium]